MIDGDKYVDPYINDWIDLLYEWI